MSLKQFKLRLVVVLAAIFVLFLSRRTQAQQPESIEAFVYGINATTPGEVYANLSPPQVDEIYILADRVSMLSPRRTNIYFWPLTQRYQANWSELNEPLDGVLEIVEDNRVVSTVNMTSYTVHYVVAGTTVGELFFAEEAQEADARHHLSQQAHLQAMTEYRQTRLQWLLEARKARQAGEPVRLEEEPQRPESFTTLSVGLQQGFPLILEAGEHQIRMRDGQGEIIAGSERTVHVFESRQTTLGFEVINEELWTTPLQVNDAADVIPAEPSSVIFLRPRLVHEYPALEIERLQDAQFSGEPADNTRWLVDFGYTHSPNDVLEIVRRGKLVEQINYASYSVRYALNQDLGYEIVPYNADTPELTPRVDITGYRLQLPDGIDSFTIRLGPQDNPPLVGTVRLVRVIPQDLSIFLIPVAAIILLIALTVVFLWWRFSKRA